MKRGISYLVFILFSLSLSNCGSGTSISSSISCSGLMILENNSFGEKADKKRAQLSEVQKKNYHKQYNRKRI
jgi:hypothetical protein